MLSHMQRAGTNTISHCRHRRKRRYDAYLSSQRDLRTMGEVALILLFIGHVCEPSPKIWVFERAILEFEFKTCIESDNER